MRQENHGDHFLSDEIFKRTNGKVKIEVYFGGTLGTAMEILNLVKGASVDMGSMTPGYFPSQFPLWTGPNNIPFVMKNLDTIIETAKRIPEEIPGVQEEFRAQNIKFLYS